MFRLSYCVSNLDLDLDSRSPKLWGDEGTSHNWGSLRPYEPEADIPDLKARRPEPKAKAKPYSGAVDLGD